LGLRIARGVRRPKPPPKYLRLRIARGVLRAKHIETSVLPRFVHDVLTFRGPIFATSVDSSSSRPPNDAWGAEDANAWIHFIRPRFVLA